MFFVCLFFQLYSHKEKLLSTFRLLWHCPVLGVPEVEMYCDTGKHPVMRLRIVESLYFVYYLHARWRYSLTICCCCIPCCICHLQPARSIESNHTMNLLANWSVFKQRSWEVQTLSQNRISISKISITELQHKDEHAITAVEASKGVQ